MEPFDGVGLEFIFQIVFLIAGCPSAELAEEDGLFVEVVDFPPTL
jgi:hypothetical protein